MTRIQKHYGFGLLEVLLSTTIFIVVVGSLVTLSRLAFRNTVTASHRAQAFNLAQEGLEMVRQMRDTAWIDGVLIANDESVDWQAYVHICDLLNPSYNPDIMTSYSAIVVNDVGAANPVRYEICYDNTIKRFGLQLAGADDTKPEVAPDTYLTVSDPGAPKWFKRYVTFEKIESTDATGKGLQLLTLGSTGLPALLGTGVEPVQAMKVKTTVEWYDFDKQWSTNLTTILTNWRPK